MFKKLRSRFLILNMTIISVVMVAAFTVIYLSAYNNTMMENRRKLGYAGSGVASISENLYGLAATTYAINIRGHRIFSKTTLLTQGTEQGSDLEISEITISSMESITLHQPSAGDAPSFSVSVDRYGGVLSINSFLDMPDETYFTAAAKVGKNMKDYGTVTAGGINWMYVTRKYVSISQFQADEQALLTAGTPHTEIIFLNITESDKTMRTLLYTLLAVGFMMLFVIFAVSYYFAGRAIKPIAAAWDRQKQFVADASHELKTPLAIINSNMDVIGLSGSEPVDSQKVWIGYIRHELGRMDKLVSSLLYLAKAEDAQTGSLPFDLSSAVLDATAAMEAIIYESGAVLEQEIEGGIIVRGDSEKVGQAILILLDNAIKYSGESGRISVSLNRQKNYAELNVYNSGKQIPPEELPKIFDRFYRIDASRSVETGCCGLGLPIAKAIVERSGGEISAKSSGYGTVFSVRLKL